MSWEHFITPRFKSIHLFLQGGKEEEIMSPTISGVFPISYQTKVLVLLFITWSLIYFKKFQEFLITIVTEYKVLPHLGNFLWIILFHSYTPYLPHSKNNIWPQTTHLDRHDNYRQLVRLLRPNTDTDTHWWLGAAAPGQQILEDQWDYYIEFHRSVGLRLVCTRVVLGWLLSGLPVCKWSWRWADHPVAFVVSVCLFLFVWY